jgi:branched-chain amino acid transport system substrate-binding protein
MSMTSIKIGYSLSLSGPLAANGQTARLAHEIWQEEVNAQGGLLDRDVELICIDDRNNAGSVADIYRKLLTDQKVDLLLGGYGNNSISPAMPVAMENKKFFVGLMGLGVNNSLAYDRFFAMIPTGPEPNTALTAGFFDTASRQDPKPRTVAIVAADADFTKNPIAGARANAERHGLDVVSETKYSLATEDFAAVLKEMKPARPDILFLCSYLKDSVGLIRAIAESDLDPLLVGGAMIGPQSSAVQSQLGPLLNGIVNYEYWLPTRAMDFSGVSRLIATYQERAKGTPADALGYYVAPLAYAQLQVVEQAIKATGGLEDAKLADYTRTGTFHTVVGDVRFGRLGEWAAPRVLTVQFRNIGSGNVSEFAKPESRVVVAPSDYTSGDVIVPFRAARRTKP